MVASDKAHGILGKADLDLSQFGQDEFQAHTLSLRDCAYENAQIVVHLKGQEVRERRESTRNRATPSQSQQSTPEMDTKTMTLLDDLENLKKEMEKQSGLHTNQVADLSQRNNDMQTQLENTKVQTFHAQTKAKEK